jgi:hypothetical protein
MSGSDFVVNIKEDMISIWNQSIKTYGRNGKDEAVFDGKVLTCDCDASEFTRSRPACDKEVARSGRGSIPLQVHHDTVGAEREEPS